MADSLKTTKHAEGGFQVAHRGVAVRCANHRICKITKLLIVEDILNASWVTEVLNRYGSRVKHPRDRKKP